MSIVTMGREDIINYSVTEIMKDQRPITIRAIRPGDRELIAKGLPRVGADTMYRRFFAPKSGFSSWEWKSFTEVDFVNVVALVAVMKHEGEDWVIAGGRYVRGGLSGAEERAEVAFLVGDPVQGLGVGTIMMRHLIAIARASGVMEFEAEVLPSNDAMLKVFEACGCPVRTRATLDSVRVIIDLGGPRESP
jgi:RimJ/RimL family protein N-acetyltransferase